MSDFVIPAAPITSLAIEGQSQRFPVRRVFCVGRNYQWPAGAAAAEREAPFFFMKPSDAVSAAEGLVRYPLLTNDFCHEIELVVAIGKDGVNILPEHALTHVWGYAAGMDLTRRDIQMRAKEMGRPWEAAKAFDGSASSSPLLPVSAIGHPRQGAIWLKVNGVERQRADLADQIWPVQDVISFISQSVQLKAGDLIFTGTPPGVDALQAGDVVNGGIDGISQFTFTVTAR